MEIDFLGLNRKDLPKMEKDESKDVCIDSVGRVQRPHSSNASLAPLFIPLEATKQAKSGYDPISSGFLPILTGYAFGSHSKPPCIPKNNTWTLPILDKTTSASSSNFSFNNENLAAASMEQQSLRGISVGKPRSNFTKTGFDLGTTNLRNNANSSGMPAQITIFYADAVHVFQDISPQTAEAIMLIAGNGCADAKNLSKPVSEDIHSNLLLQAPDHTLHSRQNAGETFIEGSTSISTSGSKSNLGSIFGEAQGSADKREAIQGISGLQYYSPNQINRSCYPFIQRPDTSSS